MLFNSFGFIFGFLPLAIVAFYLCARVNHRAGLLALTVLSLGFYAAWRPAHLWLLLGSIVFNYLIGAQILRAREREHDRTVLAWLVFGLAVDIALLGYFKYANFIVDNVDAAFGTTYQIERIALPLAISFFTFQKIAYLMDISRGSAGKASFLEFNLFAAFFPQLIAGPIVHYNEIIPQIRSTTFGTLLWRNLLIGTVIFAIGLFKKTVLADSLAPYVNNIYELAGQGAKFDVRTGWLAATTFTLQVYFDFSGYSDMAIGLARMFGVYLPLNFHSPLKASSIIDYWRRWHMTLQRFIVSYIFQPLSLPLKRFAASRKVLGWPNFLLCVAFPIFVTFLVVGIWHGAGWTFVIFGLMHGLYICVNEAWRERHRQRRKRLFAESREVRGENRLARTGFYVLTLAAIAFSNVMFRASSVGEALAIWRGMLGLNGLANSPQFDSLFDIGLFAALAIGILIVGAMPNTQQIMRNFRPALNWAEWRNVATPSFSWTWRPNVAGLVFAAVTLFLGVQFIQRGQAVFIYFNF